MRSHACARRVLARTQSPQPPARAHTCSQAETDGGRLTKAQPRMKGIRGTRRMRKKTVSFSLVPRAMGAAPEDSRFCLSECVLRRPAFPHSLWGQHPEFSSLQARTCQERSAILAMARPMRFPALPRQTPPEFHVDSPSESITNAR